MKERSISCAGPTGACPHGAAAAAHAGQDHRHVARGCSEPLHYTFEWLTLSGVDTSQTWGEEESVKAGEEEEPWGLHTGS
jgi:hypothetical protein